MKFSLILLLLLLMTGCATEPVIFQQDDYASMPKQHLQALTKWRFDGRMALTSQNDSWTANVKWQHKPGLDRLDLSGLLGQGATIIEIANHWVTIDNGKGPIEQSNDPDSFVSEKLGVFVPVQALASWVTGLPDKSEKEIQIQQGFQQEGWEVSYKAWLKINDKALPHKINVKNDQVKLKLVIEKWEIADE